MKIGFTPVLIIILSILVRIFFLDSIPAVLNGDEGKVGLLGREFISFNLFAKAGSLPTPGHWGIPNMYFYLTSLPMRVFGDGIFGLRMLSSLGGIAAVIIFYFLLKELFPKKYLLINLGTFLLSTSAFHIQFSRLGLGQIHDTLSVSLLLLLVLLFIKKKKYYLLLLAGFFLGLSQYFFFGARVMPFIVLFWIFILTFRAKGFSILKIPLILFCIFSIAAVVVYPLFSYEFSKSAGVFDRLNQAAIVKNIKDLEKPAVWQKIKDQISAPVVLFIKGGDKGWFYLDDFDRPVMGRIIVPFILLGFILRLFKIKDRITWSLFVWLVIAYFLNGVFSQNPPHSQRLIILLPLVLIFAIDSFQMILGLFRRKKILGIIIVLAISYAIFLEEWLFYMDEFRVKQFNNDKYIQLANYAGRYLATLPLGSTKIYFLKETNTYYNAQPSLKFLTKRDGVDIEAIDELKAFPNNQIVVIGGILKKDQGKNLLSIYPRGTLISLNNLSGEEVGWVFVNNRKFLYRWK